MARLRPNSDGPRAWSLAKPHHNHLSTLPQIIFAPISLPKIVKNNGFCETNPIRQTIPYHGRRRDAIRSTCVAACSLRSCAR